jgi:hypothetical protein
MGIVVKHWPNAGLWYTPCILPQLWSFLGQSGEIPHWIFLQRKLVLCGGDSLRELMTQYYFVLELMRIKLFLPSFLSCMQGKEKIITPSKLTIIYKASKVIIIIIIIINIPFTLPNGKERKKERMNECSSNVCTTTQMINPSIRTLRFPFSSQSFLS